MGVNRYSPVKFAGKRPEDRGLHRLRELMVQRGWLVYKSHGSVYQAGLPDLLCWHKSYGFRLLEIKTRTGTFTPAQRELFHKISAHGGQIWVIVVDDPPDDCQLLDQLEILHSGGNWTMFLKF